MHVRCMRIHTAQYANVSRVCACASAASGGVRNHVQQGFYVLGWSNSMEK